MKIELDLDYTSAVELKDAVWDRLYLSGAEALQGALQDAIDNEDERHGMAHAKSLMESVGLDDSKYRQDMKYAGRGHLLR